MVALLASTTEKHASNEEYISQTDEKIRECLSEFVYRSSPGCTCKTPCQETVFRAIVTKTVKAPSRAVIITVFFEDLTITHVTELPAYDHTRFLADIGGLIGLLAGISMLSVFEVVACIMLYATDFILMLEERFS